MILTVADVLGMPALSAGQPRVRVGGAALDAPVRWVHISELTEVASLLQGGELLLSTGMRLRDPDFDAAAYLRSLREVGAVGLVIELGPAVTHLPASLVSAARSLRFPLVELARPVRFVAVTEAVHGRLLVEQYEELRFSQRVHEAFTALGLSLAGPEEVLSTCSALLGRTVVLEDLGHRAVAVAGAPGGRSGAGDALVDWATRSRRAPYRAETATSGPEAWTVTPVGPVGERWGRLVVPEAVRGDHQVAFVVERAAETLTLVRLVARDERGVTETAASALLLDVVGADRHDEQALRGRARAMGLPLPGVLVPVAVHDGTARAVPLTGHVTRALRRCRLRGLVGLLRPGTVGVVLAVESEEAAARAVRALADALAGPQLPAPEALRSATLATAATSTALTSAGEGLLEAAHVAEVASGLPRHDPAVVHRSEDLGARGLLWWLRDDPRLDAYVEAQLGPLLRDGGRGQEDLQLLRDHLGVGGSMTRLARGRSTGRPGLYARVQRLSTRLGADLDDPETRTSLHVAVLAHDQRGHPPGATS